jgi:hypothetical protein
LTAEVGGPRQGIPEAWFGRTPIGSRRPSALEFSRMLDLAARVTVLIIDRPITVLVLDRPQ